MKIKAEHLEYLNAHINPVDAATIEAYQTGQFPRADRVKDLQKRFAWDLLYSRVGATWVCDNLSPYLNDSHINSALNSIVPKLEVTV